MKKSSRSGILLVSVGPYVVFIYDEVVEIVGDYDIREIFSSYCDKSGAPLGIFGIIVSSSYESTARSVKEVIKVFFSNGVSGRAIYC